jgi:hypothetical protein
MRHFNFRKLIRLNTFTKVFGSIGKRRTIKDFVNKPKRIKTVSKIQRIRRSKSGYKNNIHGRLTALRFRLIFGRRAPAKKFKR